jgi:DNA polymerase-3 subunit delta'
MPVLIGQQRAETVLARAVARDRVGHAYLFLSPPGCGKATAARLFAQAVNCERQPAVADDDGHPRLAPCGECASCRRILAETHPEVAEIRPGSKSGQDITIEQIRELRRNAALRPKLGRRRFYLLPHAEALNESSSNALLKTLEEPSPFVVLVLCAPSPAHVLPTIQSRCQIVRFHLAPPDEIARALTAQGTTPAIAAELARACGGRPGTALGWSQTPAVLKRRRAVLDVFHQALAAQPEAAKRPGLGVLSLRLGEELKALLPAESGAEDAPRPAKALHSDNLEIGLSYLRDLLVLTEGAPPETIQNQDRLPQLRELSPNARPARVLLDLESVRQAQQLLERNVAPQLVLERMFWAILCGPVPLPEELFPPEA